MKFFGLGLVCSLCIHLLTALVLRAPRSSIIALEPVWIVASRDISRPLKKKVITVDSQVPHGDGDRSNEVIPIGRIADAGNLLPSYPVLAVESGWEGTVVLRLTVDGGGRIGQVSVDQSSGHSLLDSSARAAARSWRLTQVASREVLVPIEFSLE